MAVVRAFELGRDECMDPLSVYGKVRPGERGEEIDARSAVGLVKEERSTRLESGAVSLDSGFFGVAAVSKLAIGTYSLGGAGVVELSRSV